MLGLAGVLVVTASCGARWDDKQQKAVLSRNTGGQASLAAGTARQSAAAGDATATEDAPLTPGAPVAASPGVTTAPGAQPAAGAAASTGAKPCAAPSTAPGVSAKEIVIGSISTLSGPVPGLGASARAATQAYVAYRNSTGGVCGRKLVLKSVDDGDDNGRNRALVTELGKQALGLAGGLSGGDAGGAEVVGAQKIPAVSTAISDAFQNTATVFDINPPFANVNAVIGKFKYMYDQGVRKAAVVYLGVDQTRSEIQGKQIPQMKAAGIQIVNEQSLPLSTLSYDSAARGVANSGADYLLFLADAGASASMAKSMHDTGYKLKFAEYLTAYGSNFIDLAGAAAEGGVSWIRSLPNEEPNTTPEQTAYLKWMAQTAPDAVADTFAADSWAAVKAFVDGLDALKGPISREALLAQLRSVGDYDAGGLHGPFLLGAKRAKGCMIAMRVEGGKWKRVTPAKGFMC
jgi:ABC-type branched-subunit amino acid transport system substrate-binding protein